LAQELESIFRQGRSASDRAREGPLALVAWSTLTSPGGECRVLSPPSCNSFLLDRAACWCLTRLDGWTRH
jgi:hypothetical protein